MPIRTRVSGVRGSAGPRRQPWSGDPRPAVKRVRLLASGGRLRRRPTNGDTAAFHLNTEATLLRHFRVIQCSHTTSPCPSATFGYVASWSFGRSRRTNDVRNHSGAQSVGVPLIVVRNRRGADDSGNREIRPEGVGRRRPWIERRGPHSGGFRSVRAAGGPRRQQGHPDRADRSHRTAGHGEERRAHRSRQSASARA